MVWIVAFFVYAAMSFVCGMFCNHVADAKGYNGVAWMFGGFFFGLIALVAIAGMPPANQTVARVVHTGERPVREVQFEGDQIGDNESVQHYIARMKEKQQSTPPDTRQP